MSRLSSRMLDSCAAGRGFKTRWSHNTWLYLPAYFCPCTSRGCSRGCTYQYTPALVPLGDVPVGVLTSILFALSEVFSWVYLPAYFCPCTSRGCSRTLRDTRAAHVTHHTETDTAALNIQRYDKKPKLNTCLSVCCRCHQSPKQGYQWPHKKDWCPPLKLFSF